MAKIDKALAVGEIEIVWLKDGAVEYFQTQGMAASGTALVLDMGKDKLIIPFTSVKRYRVPSVASAPLGTLRI